MKKVKYIDENTKIVYKSHWYFHTNGEGWQCHYSYILYRRRTFFGIPHWKYIVFTFAQPDDNDTPNDERNPIVRLYNWEKEIIKEQNGIF